jgi:hypothetical protein
MESAMPLAKGKSKKQKSKMGRPVIDIPLDILDTACGLDANMNQLLELLDRKGIKVTDDTVNNFCKRNFKMTFSEYKDKKFEHTRIMLKQKALKMAMTDSNTAMMIFCLKNFCKWTDRAEMTHTGELPTVVFKSGE